MFFFELVTNRENVQGSFCRRHFARYFYNVRRCVFKRHPVSATAYSVTGTVEYAPPDSISFRPLKAGQVLAIGCTVRTGDDGKAILRTTPGSAIELGNDTNLKINELAFQKAGGAVTERKARLELTSGVVNVLVDPSTPKVTDFQIQTPEGAAAARGSVYTVIVKDGKTYATVGEGDFRHRQADARTRFRAACLGPARTLL